MDKDFSEHAALPNEIETPSFAWDAGCPPIVIVGPTASGKTDTAIALANLIDGEIVNADSVQVYRGMDIGSAKPTPQEQQQAIFHLLDIRQPGETFTASDWKRLAEITIQDIRQRGKWPIICGGTGMYIRALLDNWTMAATPADPAVRAELQRDMARFGLPALYARLQQSDPITAARLHPNDSVRIVRALEVYLVTGTPLSAYQEADRSRRKPRPALRWGLTMPRDLLYARINRRVDAMIAAGLEAEVRALLAAGVPADHGPMRSLGYKELTDYVLRSRTIDEVQQTAGIGDATDEIKLMTRRFAKRQLTWFRADPLLQWMDVSGQTPPQTAAHIAAHIAAPPPTKQHSAGCVAAAEPEPTV